MAVLKIQSEYQIKCFFEVNVVTIKKRRRDAVPKALSFIKLLIGKQCAVAQLLFLFHFGAGSVAFNHHPRRKIQNEEVEVILLCHKKTTTRQLFLFAEREIKREFWEMVVLR